LNNLTVCWFKLLFANSRLSLKKSERLSRELHPSLSRSVACLFLLGNLHFSFFEKEKGSDRAES